MNLLEDWSEHEDCVSSTPICATEKLHCTLSSISNPDSGSSSSKTRKSKLSLITNNKQKHMINNEERNESMSDSNSDSSSIKNKMKLNCSFVTYKRKYTINNRDGNSFVGDTLRNALIISPDIEPCSLKQLFYRSQSNDSLFHKNENESFSFRKISVYQKDTQLTSDSLFNGDVGEHSRTYYPIFHHNNKLLPLKEHIHFNTLQADILWDNFIKDNPLNPCKKKKPNPIVTKLDRKFFKYREEILQHRNEIIKKSLMRKKKNKYVKSESTKWFTPSFYQPLGWMAIKGICIAERREACDELIE